jgi:hypothetical protein
MTVAVRGGFSWPQGRRNPGSLRMTPSARSVSPFFCGFGISLSLSVKQGAAPFWPNTEARAPTEALAGGEATADRARRCGGWRGYTSRLPSGENAESHTRPSSTCSMNSAIMRASSPACHRYSRTWSRLTPKPERSDATVTHTAARRPSADQAPTLAGHVSVNAGTLPSRVRARVAGRWSRASGAEPGEDQDRWEDRSRREGDAHDSRRGSDGRSRAALEPRTPARCSAGRGIRVRDVVQSRQGRMMPVANLIQ